MRGRSNTTYRGPKSRPRSDGCMGTASRFPYPRWHTTRMNKIELTGRIAAALAGLIAAWLLARFADASGAVELGHGALTGIFVKIALAAAFALAIAAPMILRQSKYGFRD